jgi:phosphoesterase RecJ-like protein
MTTDSALPTQFGEWLDGRRNLLLLTHQRPDGDALGSLFGMYHCLQAQGIDAVPYISEEVPDRYLPYAPAALVAGGEFDIDACEGAICLDCANERRLALPDGVAFDDLRMPICSIDHHVDNTRYGDVALIDSASAATAEILAGIARGGHLTMTPEAATAMLIGVVTDTGGFRFSNTKQGTLDMTAWLVGAGADYDRVMGDVFFSEPINLLRLQARVFSEMRFSYDGRLVYFFLDPEMLEEFGIESQDTEDIIETARVIRGAEVVCRMQLVDGGVRYSLRSKRIDLPIIGVAHKLGGGGHKLAAGAFQENIDLETAEQLLLEYTAELFE